MARQLRPNIAGGIYHLMSRGNERRAIFRDDRDRERFLDLLQRVAGRYRWQCLAYCLMGNHYHLIVRTPLPNLSRGMRLLNGRYATGFNARYERVGHLFQGRYRSVLIRDAEHLTIVLKYVIRNPIAAGYCERPQEWPWSSYQATIGRSEGNVVARQATLAWFGEGRDAAGRFIRYMCNDHSESGEISLPSGELCTQPVDHEITRPPVESVLAAHPGAAGIALAYHEHCYSLREIATWLGRSRAVVGRQLVAYDAEQMLESAT